MHPRIVLSTRKMVNLHDGPDGDYVMVGSGTVVEVNEIGNILGEVCNNRGTILIKGQMVNVAHYSEIRYNVYNLTMKLLEEWVLHGNKDIILIAKGNEKLYFDIKLKTKRGVMYYILLSVSLHLRKLPLSRYD